MDWLAGKCNPELDTETNEIESVGQNCGFADGALAKPGDVAPGLLQLDDEYLFAYAMNPWDEAM